MQTWGVGREHLWQICLFLLRDVSFDPSLWAGDSSLPLALELYLSLALALPMAMDGGVGVGVGTVDIAVSVAALFMFKILSCVHISLFVSKGCGLDGFV